MTHQAIYRQYRPKTFDEVKGQQHLTETLKNQILRDAIAHAYLFSGIRGTGKTSTAKIFARAVNCTNNTTGNPCNVCDSCLSILSERSMDVIEMDAASNNSVEDIRDLREKVKYMPTQNRYKVYIIDEVHMLSKGAFNALLKTLEEPPAHLLFILATTEPQKIPATILSRCQRFDLKRINVSDMVDGMLKITENLGVTVEQKALRLIANRSEGAMRDALSILDRCLVYNQKTVTYEDVSNLLGVVNYDRIIQLTDYLIESDVTQALMYLHGILSEGKEVALLVQDLIDHFRNLLMVEVVKDMSVLGSIGEDDLNTIIEQGKKFSATDKIRYIESLSELLPIVKKSLNERVLLETQLIKLMVWKPIMDPPVHAKTLSTTETKINKVDKQVAQGENKQVNKAEKGIKAQFTTGQTAVDDDFLLKATQENWETLMAGLKKVKISLHAVVKEATPYRVKEGRMILLFDPQYTFHYERANEKSSIELVEKIFSAYFKKPVHIGYQLGKASDDFLEETKETEDDPEYLSRKARALLGDEKLEIID